MFIISNGVQCYIVLANYLCLMLVVGALYMAFIMRLWNCQGGELAPLGRGGSIPADSGIYITLVIQGYIDNTPFIDSGGGRF